MSEEIPGQRNGSTSLFLKYMRELAEEQGRELGQVLAAEKRAATERIHDMTEDCLLPDEVDALLTSPDIECRNGRLEVMPGHHPSSAEIEAIRHVESCNFCKPLLLLMQPRIDEKKRFLDGVRHRQQRHVMRDNPETDEAYSRLNTWPPARAFLPAMIPLGIGTYAFSRFAPIPDIPWTEAFSVSWPVIVTAGAFGGTLGWVGAGGTAQLSLKAPNSNERPWFRFTATASLCASVAMVISGMLATYHTERAVVTAQQTMLHSAITKLTDRSTLAPPFGADESKSVPCQSKNGAADFQVCEVVERSPVSVRVVGEIGKDSADIYWSARGERWRESQLVRAQVETNQDGAKQLVLASGDVLPLNDASKQEYPVGTPVLAIKNGETLLRDAKGLSVDHEATKYPLLRVAPNPAHTPSSH